MIDCWGLSYQTFTLRLNFLFHQQIVRAPLSSCRTVNIRAKYLGEVHWAPLLVVVTKEFAYEPLFFQIYPFSTVLCSPTVII
jgi:hypothetical protein